MGRFPAKLNTPSLTALANRMNATGSVVVMGVAGCGKSTVAQALGGRCGWPVVEGDDFHAPASRQKMQQGIALTDADREGWLDSLAAQLGQRPGDLVLTCSALKRAYRDRLRAACLGLRFVFLDIDRATSHARVAARAAKHLFPASLVDSQFAALERPDGEAGVLTVDAAWPLDALTDHVCAWLKQDSP